MDHCVDLLGDKKFYQELCFVIVDGIQSIMADISLEQESFFLSVCTINVSEIEYTFQESKQQER